MQNEFIIDIIVVEPAYQLNLGYIARVSKNFGVRSIKVVNPKCNIDGKKAVMYSKHGVDLLKGIKKYKSMKDAAKDSFIIGSTAIAHKANAALYNVYSIDDLYGMLKRNNIQNISLVLGRESTGLTREELTYCDATITIPIDSDYRVLNISHALGIMLYVLHRNKMHTSAKMYASVEQLNGIIKLFKKSISSRNDIRNKNTVASTFEHLLKRANPTKKELNALAISFYKPKYIAGNAVNKAKKTAAVKENNKNRAE